MATTGERILNLMNNLKMTKEELSKRSDLGEITLERIISGYSSPTKEELLKIASSLGVDTEYLSGEMDTKFLSEPINKIPILKEFPGKVSTNEDIRKIEAIGHITGNYRKADMDCCYFVIAKDDSMLFAKIGAGDKVLINPKAPFESGGLAVVKIDDGECMIRRVYRAGTKFRIESECALPEVEFYDITEHEITILGMVVFAISYPL